MKGTPCHQEQVLILRDGLNKPGERAHVFAVMEFEPKISLSTVQRLTTELSSLTNMCQTQNEIVQSLIWA